MLNIHLSLTLSFFSFLGNTSKIKSASFSNSKATSIPGFNFKKDNVKKKEREKEKVRERAKA